MSIHKIGSDLIRPPGTKPASRGNTSSATEGQATPRRADIIEISDEGRELVSAVGESRELSEGQRALIEERIASGFYDTPSVAEGVAERLIEDGELGE